MEAETIEAFIEHVGVKGMKWGVRKRPVRKGPASDDARDAGAIYAKVVKGGTRSVSNAELKKLVDRMDLEKRYKNIAPPPKPGPADMGKKFAAGLGKFGFKAVQGAANTVLQQAVRLHLEQKMGVSAKK